MAKHRRKYPVCPNCNFSFEQEQPDNFCPRCGQENHDLNVPFNHVALELLEGTIHYDSKFWTTVKYLLFYPGKLTKEFHRGRRMGYVPPIRLYVFISFVFFFLLSLRVGHMKDGDTTLQDDFKVISQEDRLERLASASQTDESTRQALAKEQSLQDSLLVLSSEQEIEQFAKLGSLPHHASTAQLDAVLTDWGIESKNRFTRGSLQKLADLQRLTKNELNIKAVKYLSVMMFVLMPVFALLLQMVFRKARRFYVEHLIFSIHLHCFFFVAYSICLLLLYLSPSFSFFGWVSLLSLLYLYLGLKQVFKYSYLRTFFNMAGLLCLYFFAGIGTLTLGLLVNILL